MKTLSELEDECVYYGEELSDRERERHFLDNVSGACTAIFVIAFCACFFYALCLFFDGNLEGVNWTIGGGIILAYYYHSSSHPTGIFNALSLWQKSISRRESEAWRAFEVANDRLFVVQVVEFRRRYPNCEIVVENNIDRPLFIVTKSALMEQFITGSVKYFTLKHSGHVFPENIV